MIEENNFSDDLIINIKLFYGYSISIQYSSSLCFSKAFPSDHTKLI